MSKFKFFALGGNGEDGKNMYCVETPTEILVVDAGLKYPPSTMFGINTIIADYAYLTANKDKVKGILISHGHDDQIGALKFIVKDFPHIKIHATGIAIDFVKRNLKETNYNLSNLVSYDPSKTLKVGSFEIDFAGVCHNTVDNHIAFIKSGDESIVYATDFIMAQDEYKAFSTDRNKINELARKHNVTLLAIEAIGASINSLIAPKHKISSYIEDDVLLHKGRMFFTVYEQNILYAKEIINTAKKFGKKVIFYGETFNNVMKEVFARDIISKEGVILGNYKDINKETNAVIIIAGNSERLFDKVNKIADGGIPEITFKSTDLFINAAPAFDGREVKVSRMMDAVAKCKIGVKSLPFKNILPTHAGIEDIKQLVQIIEPKYIVPIKGGWKALSLFETQMSKFVDPKSIFTIDNGDVLNFENGNHIPKKEYIEVSEILSQTSGKEQIVNAVLDDRERLARSGIVLIAAAMSKEGELLGDAGVSIKGISVEDLEPVKSAIVKIASKEIINKHSEGLNKLRVSIRNKVQRYLLKNYNKQPQVLTVISSVNRNGQTKG